MPTLPPANGMPDTARGWASLIIATRKRLDRAALLSQVPENLRPIAETHVRCHFARKASEKRPD